MDLGWTIERKDGEPDRRARHAFHNKILFCDVIGYSRRKPLSQAACQDALDEAVEGVLGELDCDRAADVITLPTGDGMLLNFLAPPLDIHLRAAVGLLKRWPSGALGADGEVGLKIGLNTHEDAWRLDINGQRNVVGDGVNTAQRIMDLARHGQILMHDKVREQLSHSPEYAARLSFRGDFRVKHGVNVPVAQFVDPSLPFVSDQLIQPLADPPDAAAPMSLSQLFQQMRDERVLHLVLGPGDALNLRHIQDGVEAHLHRHGSLQRLRLRVHWLVGELLDNVFRHGGLLPGEQAELRIDIARDGLVVETSQPKRPGFEGPAILSGPAADESFLRMMGLGGLTPRVYDEADRLVIGLKLPIDEGLAETAGDVPSADGHRSGWTSDRAGGSLVARPVGRVDETTHEAFTQHLLSAMDEAQAQGLSVILDLAGLDYMSSRGLRALTLAHRRGGAGSLVLAAPNARLREILAISRYDKLFEVRDSV